jgi:hypothetical protein
MLGIPTDIRMTDVSDRSKVLLVELDALGLRVLYLVVDSIGWVTCHHLVGEDYEGKSRYNKKQAEYNQV